MQKGIKQIKEYISTEREQKKKKKKKTKKILIKKERIFF